MGTVAYMSPEQARGWALDGRTDLFSFGGSLYEMATGKPAFEGHTSAVLFEAILNREPVPSSQVNNAMPTDLDRIVGRALEKDRDVRYQTARDLLADLKRLRRDTTSGKCAAVGSSMSAPAPTAPSGATFTPRTRRRIVAVVAALLVVGLGALAVRLALPPPVPRVKSYSQITSDRVRKSWPVTDGARVYFIESPRLDTDVLAQVAAGGGETIRLPTPFAALSLCDLSPDGSEFLLLAEREFTGTTRFAPQLWTAPVVGGTPRRVGDLEGNGAVWSPDKTRVAYTTGSDVLVAASDGSGSRKLWTAPGKTPDGRYFVFEARGERSRDIWALAEQQSWFQRRRRQPVRLTQGPLDFYNPVPSRDGRKIFAVGEREQGELVRHATRFSPCVT